MHAVDLYLVISEGESNVLPVGKALDTVQDVVEATRDYVQGPLRDIYPALYPFAEFGLQAVEGFSIAMCGGADYTAKIGVADLSAIPILDRETAGRLAANFVTALHIARGSFEEAALTLVETEYTNDWQNASFTVEPGYWLTRHLKGEAPFSPPPLSA